MVKHLIKSSLLLIPLLTITKTLTVIAMNKIYIQNNLITYESEFNGIHKNGYWTAH
ncbi:hypothetical protein T190820D02B_10504 [Tenacibaculum sp. 190524A05c]